MLAGVEARWPTASAWSPATSRRVLALDPPDRRRRAARAGAPGPLAFVAGAAGGSCSARCVLTGGPVLLAPAGGAPAEVTALFAGLALFRAPYTWRWGWCPS